MPAAQLHRRGLYAVLCEHRRGVGGEAADDQGQIVLLRLANSSVGGGVKVSQRQVQSDSSPKMSFSFNRCPFAKSAAAIRLRPSSCTSTSSSDPEPQPATSGLKPATR